MKTTAIRTHSAKFFFLLVLLASLGVSAQAQNKYTTPNGAKISVSLHPEKTSIVLGESIDIIFRITNESSREVSFVTGGDYRNRLGIPLSFGVSVTDEEGKKIAGPEIKEWFGGLSGGRVLKRGEFFDQDIILPFWADITRPGKYKIKVAWSLRKEVFNDSDSFPVEAETTITVALPTDQELGDLISRLDRQLAVDDQYRSFEAAYCLARIGDKRTTPILLRIVQETSPNGNLFLEAVKGLLASKDENAFAGLVNLFIRPNAYTRFDTMNSLGEEDRHRAISRLIKFKSDPNPAVRCYVARNLPTIKHPEATKVLTELLEDVEPSVREAAKANLIERKARESQFLPQL